MSFALRGVQRVFHSRAWPTGATAGGAAPLPAVAKLDAAALEKLRELDPQGQTRLLDRVFAAFEASLLRMLPQLVNAERCADWDAVRHVTHTLKSSAATVGALDLARMCAEIETLLRDAPGSPLADRVDEVVVESAAVRMALQAAREARP